MKTVRNAACDPSTCADPRETERILAGMIEFDNVCKWVEGLVEDVNDRPEQYRRKPELMLSIIGDLEFAVSEIRELEKTTWEMVTAWLDLRRMMGE